MSCSTKKLKIVSPEDRISSLPDDLIHQIMSFIDAKDAVQTTLLSTRWNNLWKSLSHLNFDSSYFPRMSDFPKFVAQFLRHRDRQSNLSVFNLSCRGVLRHHFIKNIATYGAFHNLHHLTISSNNRELPPSVFTSQSLQQLCLKGRQIWEFPKHSWSSWNLPALTTMFLQGFEFCLNGDGTTKSLDLFSNLLNLKKLSLINCKTGNLEVFYIIAPQLENLDIKFDVFEACKSEFVISAPKLSSFKYRGGKPLLLLANDLNCLDRVHIDIDISYMLPVTKQRCQGMCPEIMNMFHQLRVAKFVTLTLRTVVFLSWVLELLENQESPFDKMESPFDKMECLKIEGGCCWEGAILSRGVLTYLCNSSPTSTIINEYNTLFQGP